MLTLTCYLAGLWIWLGIAPHVGAIEQVDSASALDVALGHEAVRDRLRDRDSLRITVRFIDQWDCWMVEGFAEDERLVFATVSLDGDILEIGPNAEGQEEVEEEEVAPAAAVEGWLRELEVALAAGNAAEVAELRELIERHGGEMDREVDVYGLLRSLSVQQGHRMRLVRWSAPERGRGRVWIERHLGDQAWESVAELPVAERWWIDESIGVDISVDVNVDVEAKSPSVWYRLRYQDPEGNPGIASDPVSPRPLPESSAPALPRYSLTLPEDGLARMRADVTEDITVAGDLVIDGRRHPVRVRFRGASTRHAAKKSYRIEFANDSPLGRDVTYLKAEPGDYTMQVEKLTCDVFRACGMPVSEADYVAFYLNGRYEGVYLDIEPTRAPFKNRPGLDPRGTLIRASTFQHLDDDRHPIGRLRGDQGSVDELHDILRALNRTDRGDFEGFVRTRMNWPRVRDYLALQTVCHRSEVEADDYLFYSEPDSGQWWLLGRDHNNGNFGYSGRNQLLEPFQSVFHQAIQTLGWRPEYWFVLRSRIYQNPVLRNEYLDRLEELTRQVLLGPMIQELIDSNFNAIRRDFLVDPYRRAFSGEDPFLDSPRHLKAFARKYGERILNQIDEARRSVEAGIVINEYRMTDRGGWIELRNTAARNLSPARYILATKRGGRNGVLPIEAEAPLKPGARLVVSFGHRDPLGAASENSHGDWQIAEESDDGDRRRRMVPEFSQGGFLALVERAEFGGGEALDEGKPWERVQDFVFFGPSRQGLAYGRDRSGNYGWMAPTPGSQNGELVP